VIPDFSYPRLGATAELSSWAERPGRGVEGSPEGREKRQVQHFPAYWRPQARV